MEDVKAAVQGGFDSLGSSAMIAWSNIGAWPWLALVEYGSAYVQEMAATAATNNPTYQRAVASIVRAGAMGMSMELWNGYKG